MILGVSSYTFTWAVGVKGHPPKTPLTWKDLIKMARNLGVGLIQIADNMPLHSMADEEIDRLIQEASGNNIRIETGANRLTSENLEKYLDIADRMHSELLRFVIDAEGYKPEIKEVISIIKNSEPELKKRRIILALENHDRFLTTQFSQMIEEVASP